MKRWIEILLIIALLLPMAHDLKVCGEPAVVVADDGWCFGAEEEGELFSPILTTLSLTILLKATTLRRFSIVRVKCLRLLRQRLIVKSESARHSEMRSGDVSSMRI